MSGKEKKYFPITQGIACQLKWTWSTIWLYSGETASCHRASFSKITSENFDSFHNTPEKLNARKLMLDGQWPTGGCEYCQKIEAAGGSSDRIFQKTIPDLSPLELETDPTAIQVTPKILEVYLNNTCNFGCIYCYGVHSSRLNHENKKFEDFIEKKDYKTRFSNLQIIEETSNKDLLTEKFITWLEKNSQSLKRLQVLGGEPFYQKEFDLLLDFLSTHSNPNLELGIITNLGISQDKLISYIEKIKLLVSQKKIRRLDIICSIDCWGPEQEYIRYGLNLSSWESNFNYLLDQKWIVLNINQTISALAIKTIPDLLKKLKIWKSKRPVGYYFSELVPGPSYLKPDIFGPDFFAEDFKNILALLDDNTNQEKETKKYMSGIFNKISSNKGNTQEIKDLIIYLDEIDRRRNTNWKTTFPWLEEFKDVV